jgi:hypothetical protein
MESLSPNPNIQNSDPITPQAPLVFIPANPFQAQLPFKPKKKEIPDEIINMDFLSKLTQVSLTSDNGLIKFCPECQSPDDALKKVLRTGGSVNVAWESRYENGQLVDPKRNRTEKFKFKIDQNDNKAPPIGLGIASSYMRLNEESWYKMTPEYHKDPNASDKVLFYKMKLDYYKKPQGPNDKADYAEVLEFLEDAKKSGNECFKAGDWAGAEREYEMGYNFSKSYGKDFLKALDDSRR